MRAKCESKPANLLYKLCWHSPGHELWVVTQRMTLLTQMAEIRVARFSFRDKARLLCLDMTWNQISSTKLGWMDRWVSIVFNQIQTKYGLCLLHLCFLTSVSQTTQLIFYGDHFSAGSSSTESYRHCVILFLIKIPRSESLQTNIL